MVVAKREMAIYNSKKCRYECRSYGHAQSQCIRELEPENNVESRYYK